jgi:hypothetical protein
MRSIRRSNFSDWGRRNQVVSHEPIATMYRRRTPHASACTNGHSACYNAFKRGTAEPGWLLRRRLHQPLLDGRSHDASDPLRSIRAGAP